MDRLQDKRRERPEAKIQRELIDYLKKKDWLVRTLHGNAMNYGWPDLWITHSTYGQRWVEVKLPKMKGSRFTAAQREWYPKMMAHGTGIWILTGADSYNYGLLFKPANAWSFL